MSAVVDDSVDGQTASLVALPARTSSQQVRLLLRLSESLAGASNADDVSRAVSTVAGSFFGAIFGGVAVLEPDRVSMRYLDVTSLPEALSTLGRFPLASARPAALAARDGRAVLIESVHHAHDLDQTVLAAALACGGDSLAYMPMRIGPRVIGCLTLIWAHPVAFTPGDRDLLSGLAAYAAQALDRAQLLADRVEVARVLQAALLPTLPDVDWIDVAGEYRPASAVDMVGGDWYDAFITAQPGQPDGQTLTAVIGDVTGHDTQAAAYMGRLQAKVRALALDSPDAPGRLLQRLERVMEVTKGHRLVTAITATLTPAPHGEVTLDWSNAGHLPPLLLAPGRPAQFLERPPQLLLGLDPNTPRRTDSVTLPPSSTLLLYTDGLIERRHKRLDLGQQELARAAEQHRHLPTASMATAIMEQLLGDGQDDDTALLAIRTHPEG